VPGRIRGPLRCIAGSPTPASSGNASNSVAVACRASAHRHQRRRAGRNSGDAGVGFECARPGLFRPGGPAQPGGRRGRPRSLASPCEGAAT
jgi:hypothetical protein